MANRVIRGLCLFFGALSLMVSAMGQNVRNGRVVNGERHIEGVLVDSENGETLPFSNVFVRGTLVGTQTDIDGNFSLNVPLRYDSLWFGAIGYTELRLPMAQLVKSDSLVVKLRPDNLALDEVLVTPDDAPRRLMKAVFAHKDENDPMAHQRTEYEKYTRWTYSLSNISDRAQRNWLLKNTKDLMHVASEDSSRHLPVYFSETLSKNETQLEPRKMKSTILADEVKGIDIFKQYEVGGFSSAMDVEFNFYDDVVKMLGVGFVSPIAKDGLRYYDYFIEDSVMTAGPRGHETDSIKIYNLMFRPKHVGDKVFQGTMDIETRRFSPTRITADVPKGTNINFVKRLRLESTYQMVDDTIPFFGTNTMDALVDYMPVNTDKKRLSVHCQMFNSQSKVRLDMDEPLELSKKALSVETVKADGYKTKDDDFWEVHRHSEMSDEQKRTTQMIDSLNNVGSIKAFNYLTKAAITGYLDVGSVEIGSLGEMFNTNKIEGLHLGVGLRTSKEVSEQWVVSGIVGYGFKNTRPTYGAGVGYRFKSPMRRTLELNYYDRLVKIGEDENILYLYENMLSTSETNIVAQLFKRGEIDELMYSQKLRLRYDNEWFTGFQTRLTLAGVQQESPKYYPFTQGGESISYVKGLEAALDFRFSFREKFMDDGLQRMYLSTDFPIFHITVAGGATKVGSEESRYARIHTTMKNKFYFGQTNLDVAIENGIYFGKLPYTLMNVARGNKTYGFYRYDFNLMNYLEFVCDRYLYIHADYALNGLVLHKLPAIHKLGLREVVGAKFMLGGLDDSHLSMLDLPEGVGGPTKPYLELNVGFDNILRFFRFDYVWKAVGNSNSDAPKWGIRAQFNVKL